MVGNTLIVTIALHLALGFWLMDELKFLIPYRHFLLREYGGVLLEWLAVLFMNVFAAVYFIQRKFFLKDTGRKLSHVDIQMAAGHAVLPSPIVLEERE